MVLKATHFDTLLNLWYVSHFFCLKIGQVLRLGRVQLNPTEDHQTSNQLWWASNGAFASFRVLVFVV